MFEETTSLLVAAGPESTSRLRSTTQPRRGEEKALVGAFSVITNLRMELFQALVLMLRIAAAPVVYRHEEAAPEPHAVAVVHAVTHQRRHRRVHRRPALAQQLRRHARARSAVRGHGRAGEGGGQGRGRGEGGHLGVGQVCNVLIPSACSLCYLPSPCLKCKHKQLQ